MASKAQSDNLSPLDPAGRPLAYSRKVAAKVFGISLSSLDRLIREGRGPALTIIGGRKLIRRQAAEDWLASLEQPVSPRYSVPSGISEETHQALIESGFYTMNRDDWRRKHLDVAVSDEEHLSDGGR